MAHLNLLLEHDLPFTALLASNLHIECHAKLDAQDSFVRKDNLVMPTMLTTVMVIPHF